MSNQINLILSQLRENLLQIYGEKLSQTILFGSQARGEATPDSDIDILIVLKGKINPGEEIKRTSYLVAQLSLEYNQVISRLFIDEEKFNNYNSPLLQNIRKEGIIF
jgi:predicted nucleotidyltransferase